jgi:hypothetical protein
MQHQRDAIASQGFPASSGRCAVADGGRLGARHLRERDTRSLEELTSFEEDA